MLRVVVRVIEDLEDELGGQVERLEQGSYLANIGVGRGGEGGGGGGGLRRCLKPAEEASDAGKEAHGCVFAI